MHGGGVQLWELAFAELKLLEGFDLHVRHRRATNTIHYKSEGVIAEADLHMYHVRTADARAYLNAYVL